MKNSLLFSCHFDAIFARSLYLLFALSHVYVRKFILPALFQQLPLSYKPNDEREMNPVYLCLSAKLKLNPISNDR